MSRKYDYGVIVRELLAWFDQNKRQLRWRSDPKPYHIWVSEIMLQQTRVEAVKAYFDRFIEALPTVQALAEEPEDKLMKLWEGLGYYNRVRNLQKAAKTVMEEYGGEIPGDFQELLKLSGIGTYTAGAIASIAFGIKEPAVDGNVLRVSKRLAGSFDDISKANVKKALENDLRKIMPEDRPGDFNQALMELGAMVCIPNGYPHCDECPLRDYCLGLKKGIMLEIPVKPEKKSRKIEEKTVLLLEYENKYAIHKRDKKGLLAGLWELPNLDGKLTINKLEKLMGENGIEKYELELLGEAKHIFSHIEWRMLGYRIRILESQKKEVEKISDLEGIVWADQTQLMDNYALPTAFSPYLKTLGGDVQN